MRKIVLAALAAFLVVCPARADVPGTTSPGIYEPQPVVTVSVATSATLLLTTIISGTSVCVTNNDTSKTLFASFNASVTSSGAAKGRPIQPGGSPVCWQGIAKGYSLYAIGTSGTTEAAVEEFRRR